jgi:hypothetical protein
MLILSTTDISTTDLINSLNNTVSGGFALYAISKGSGLVPGPACTANAFIGQFTVQATDFNILLMSIVVLLTVTDQFPYTRPSPTHIAMLCVAPWIPPVITGTQSTSSHDTKKLDTQLIEDYSSKHRPRPKRIRSHIRQLVLDNTQTRRAAVRSDARLAHRYLPHHHLHLYLHLHPPHEDLRQHLGAHARISRY